MHTIFRDILETWGAIGSWQNYFWDTHLFHLRGQESVSAEIIAFDFISCNMMLNRSWDPYPCPFSLSNFLHQLSNFVLPETFNHNYFPYVIRVTQTLSEEAPLLVTQIFLRFLGQFLTYSSVIHCFPCFFWESPIPNPLLQWNCFFKINFF